MPSSIDAASPSGQHRRRAPGSARGRCCPARAQRARARSRAARRAAAPRRRRRAGAANIPPSGAANPCTAPSPAFARHSPPNETGERQRLAIVGVDRLRRRGRRRARAAAPSPTRDPFARERVGGWVGADRQERLDQLRQRVEAAGSEHRRRQAGEQIGIDDRHARQHQRAAQARLHAVLGRREHRVLRHLRARARGGRDGDERQRRDAAAACRGRRPPGSRADRRRWRPAPRSPSRRRARCRRRSRSPDRSRPRAPRPSPARAVSTVGSPSTENARPANARRRQQAR